MFSQFLIQNGTDWVPVWLHTNVIVIWQNNFRCQFWNRSFVFFLVYVLCVCMLVNQMKWKRLSTVPYVHECHQIIIFVRFYNDVHIDSIWCSLNKSINIRYFHHSHWLYWWIHCFCYYYMRHSLKDLNFFLENLKYLWWKTWWDKETCEWHNSDWFKQNRLVSKTNIIDKIKSSGKSIPIIILDFHTQNTALGTRQFRHMGTASPSIYSRSYPSKIFINCEIRYVKCILLWVFVLFWHLDNLIFRRSKIYMYFYVMI